MELLLLSFEGDVTARWATSDGHIARYGSGNGAVFPDNIRVAVLMRQLPEKAPRQHHVPKQCVSLASWTVENGEIESMRRAQTPVQSGPMPMNIDELRRALVAMGTTFTRRRKDTGKHKSQGKAQRLFRESRTRIVETWEREGGAAVWAVRDGKRCAEAALLWRCLFCLVLLREEPVLQTPGLLVLY